MDKDTKVAGQLLNQYLSPTSSGITINRLPPKDSLHARIDNVAFASMQSSCHFLNTDLIGTLPLLLPVHAHAIWSPLSLRFIMIFVSTIACYPQQPTTIKRRWTTCRYDGDQPFIIIKPGVFLGPRNSQNRWDGDILVLLYMSASRHPGSEKKNYCFLQKLIVTLHKNITMM